MGSQWDVTLAIMATLVAMVTQPLYGRLPTVAEDVADHFADVLPIFPG
jgi:hypothetical protein